MKGPKILLLCADGYLGINVLRCLSILGAEAHVLGSPRPNILWASRYCHRYVPVQFPKSQKDFVAFAEQVNSYAELNAIDVLLASDDVAARILAGIQDRIVGSKCFPTIDPDQYDSLHDKWRFANFLTKNGIPTPNTKLISSTRDIAPDNLASIEFPAMVKPLASWGSAGVTKVNDIDELRSRVGGDLPDSNPPLIVQEFVPGEDIDLSVLAIEGEIVTWTIQRWVGPGMLEFIEDDKIVEIGRDIARLSGLHGVAHFDMRQDARNKEIVVVECNPRFWNTLPASMWRGVNFVEYGINWALCGSAHSRQLYRPGPHFLPKAVLNKHFWTISTLRNFSKESLRAGVYALSDPFPPLLEAVRLCRELVWDLSNAIRKVRHDSAH